MFSPTPIVPVIMAGGAGVRFWPLSTDSLPKQFLTAFTAESLYQGTVQRACTLAPPERILVMTNEALVEHVRRQSPTIPPDNIILEPCRRDTAPAIALAAALAERRWPDSIMAVMPSDHLVRDVEGFRSTLVLAAERAATGGLGTVGIHPTYPATVYGYLHVQGDGRVRRVERFVEKPDRPRAQQFVEAGDYFWNGGIFIWKTATFLTEVERFLPALRDTVGRIAAGWGTADFPRLLRDVFEQAERVSVDYGVMEKAADVWTVTASFDWNDIGGWGAAMDLVDADAQGNRTRGTIFLDRARNNFVLSTDPGHPILCVGVQDCVVVTTPTGTLVCHHDLVDDLKPMVARLLQETL